MKNPIEPYKGTCHGCNRSDWLDVGHMCSSCFGLMDYQERSTHMAFIRWVKAGRPADNDNPWSSND